MMKRELYKMEGDRLIRLRKNCPKCGDGIFLAEHKDRLSCGQCGYTEFKGKQQSEPVKPAEKEAPASEPAAPATPPTEESPPQEPQTSESPEKPTEQPPQ